MGVFKGHEYYKHCFTLSSCHHYYCLIGETQEEQRDVVQEELAGSSDSPSTVKRDGKGYAVPSKAKNKKDGQGYASVDLLQKRLSQRKKKEAAGGAKNDEGVKSQLSPQLSPSPVPSPPPSMDPDLVDDDEPSVPPRLPQSDELIEPEKVEPPYAKVNKNKGDATQSLITVEVDDGDVEPYAAVDIVVRSGVSEIQPTTDREYDTIDTVMSPTADRPPVNVVLSELEGDYACVRRDATIATAYSHQGPDPGTGIIPTTSDDQQTPAYITSDGQTAHTRAQTEENTEL